jgi:hypothetical protein
VLDFRVRSSFDFVICAGNFHFASGFVACVARQWLIEQTLFIYFLSLLSIPTGGRVIGLSVGEVTKTYDCKRTVSLQLHHYG